MADKRTIAKRDAQVKIVNDMINKGKDLMNANTNNDNESNSKLAMIVKNIKIKRDHIDKLNEVIVSKWKISPRKWKMLLI